MRMSERFLAEVTKRFGDGARIQQLMRRPVAWIAGVMQHGEHVDAFRLWYIEDQIGKARNDRAPDCTVDHAIRLRKCGDASKPFFHCGQKILTETSAL